MANMKWIVGGAVAVGALFVLTRKKAPASAAAAPSIPVPGPVQVEEKAPPINASPKEQVAIPAMPVPQAPPPAPPVDPVERREPAPQVIQPPPNVPVAPTVPPPPITATPRAHIPTPVLTLAPPPPISPMILNQTAALPPSAINMRDAVIQTIKEPNPRSPTQTFNIAANFGPNIMPMPQAPRPAPPSVLLARQARGVIPALGTRPLGPPPIAVLPPRIVMPPPKMLPPPKIVSAPVKRVGLAPVLQTGPRPPTMRIAIPPLPRPPKVPVSTIPLPPRVPSQSAASIVSRALNLNRATRSVIL